MSQISKPLTRGFDEAVEPQYHPHASLKSDVLWHDKPRRHAERNYRVAARNASISGSNERNCCPAIKAAGSVEQESALEFQSQSAKPRAREDTEVDSFVTHIPREEMFVGGICAVAPEIIFEGMRFCFTGASKKMSRAGLVDHLIDRGAHHLENVTQELNYLVVCDDGNACWAFSCYGRKAEKAMEYRKRGFPVVIVQEVDFWDALV